MNKKLKNEIAKLIAEQEANKGNAASRINRITALCNEQPVDVAKAIWQSVMQARTSNEVRGRYCAADNLTDLCDAAQLVVSERSNA